MVYRFGNCFERSRRTGFGTLAAVIVLIAPALELRAQSAQQAATRNAPATMWDLTDLYPTFEAWNTSYDKTKAAAAKFDSYKGTLGTNAGSMFSALDASSVLNRESDRLLVYALLKADEDKRVASGQERLQQARALRTLIKEKISWMAPEIVRLGATKVKSFEAERTDLSDRFGFYLDDTLRSAPHTLGDEAEACWPPPATC